MKSPWILTKSTFVDTNPIKSPLNPHWNPIHLPSISNKTSACGFARLVRHQSHRSFGAQAGNDHSEWTKIPMDIVNEIYMGVSWKWGYPKMDVLKRENPSINGRWFRGAPVYGNPNRIFIHVMNPKKWSISIFTCQTEWNIHGKLSIYTIFPSTL